ncbi:MAG TPA: phosphopantothenoylcysteine decarboxylase, partial [Gemmatales bacterium]|nr:phosphopantothenoylcysteine decarboxylase [Gemmatales bacterium]
MNCLVTAGNTQVWIDKVRCITNIFSGRTGAQIALELHQQGHEVTLFTSRPESLDELRGPGAPSLRNFHLHTYQTYDDLQALMASHIPGNHFEAIIHSAAVSDYLSAGVYTLTKDNYFDAPTLSFKEANKALRNVAASKVKSDYDEVWMRFVKAPKLVDCIRRHWEYRGILVKFKLEVEISEKDLERVAEASRVHSQADLMVA